MKIPGWKFFFTSNEGIGIDLGHCAVKWAKVSRAGDDRFQVEALGSQPISLWKNREEGMARLKRQMEELGWEGAKVTMNLEDPSLKIRRMQFPMMPARDLMEAIRWNFREQIECPIERYRVRFASLKGFEVEEKGPCLAFGVDSEAIKNYRSIAKELGLKLTALEPAATAVAALLEYCLPDLRGGFLGLVDLGWSRAHFLVCGRGELLFSRPIPRGGALSLMQSLREKTGISIEESERQVADFHQWKTKGVPLPSTSVAELEEVFKELLSEWVVEMQRSIDAFCIQYNHEKLDRLYLCGGLGDLPELANHFGESLGVATEVFDPLKYFTPPQGRSAPPQGVEAPGKYAVALGLALPWSRG